MHGGREVARTALLCYTPERLTYFATFTFAAASAGTTMTGFAK